MTAENGIPGGRKERAAAALAVGKTLVAAAAEAGVAERTLRNWRRDAGFLARVQEYRSEFFSRATGLLSGLSADAAAALGQLLQSGDGKIVLAAARAILEAGPRLREQGELVERLEALERAAQQKKKGERHVS
jgi:hypothetical protein